MKKKYLLVMILVLFLILGFSSKVNAASRSFSFTGEPVILNDYSDIEILNNEVVINEDTSDISNKILFKNNSGNELIREGRIKLEDSSNGLKINDLKIVVNGIEIENYNKEEDGTYKFYFKINANEGKEIIVTYKTTNSLQDAKVIKYSLDSIKGKHVDRLFVKVIMNKYDIPLVEKIWPGAYEFENNEVYTEYIDFDVNNLTKDIIIKKDTYSNMKYGDYFETLTEDQKYILENYKEIIDGSINKDIDSYSKSDNFRSILEYAYTLKNEKSFYDGEFPYGEQFNSFIIGSPLVYQLMFRNKSEVKLNNDIGNGDATEVISYPYSSGNKIAINYHESEEGKNLYVIKDTSNSLHSVEQYEPELLKKDEYTILRTSVVDGAPPLHGAYGGEKFIYVNSDIDGNKIDISEEEIVDFVNMVNVDLYVRKVLYDPSTEYPDVLIGYYDENSRPIAKGFLNIEAKVKAYKKVIELVKQGIGYESFSEERKIEVIERYNSDIDAFDRIIRLFNNETVKNNCKVPVLAECVGKVEFLSADEIRKQTIGRTMGDNYSTKEIESKYTSSEGQYVVDFYGGFGTYSLAFYPVALNTKEAKNLIETNKARNDEIKKNITDKINGTTIEKDSEEYMPEKEEIEEIEESKKTNNILQDENVKIILAAIVAIMVLLMVFFIYNIRKVIKNRK